jgi:hypothetical protein
MESTKIRFDLNVNENGATIVNFNHMGFKSMEDPYPMINTTWGTHMYFLKLKAYFVLLLNCIY